MSDTLLEGTTPGAADTGPEVTPLGEGRMVREDYWREVHRLFHVERRSKSEIARRLALDRKTVRGILHEAGWQPYARAARTDTLLSEHLSYLQTRAPQVQYSARILFQELSRSSASPSKSPKTTLPRSATSRRPSPLHARALPPPECLTRSRGSALPSSET